MFASLITPPLPHPQSPYPLCLPLLRKMQRFAQFWCSVSPLAATLTDTPSRKSFPCHSYKNTGYEGVSPHSSQVFFGHLLTQDPTHFHLSPLSSIHCELFSHFSLHQNAATPLESSESELLRKQRRVSHPSSQNFSASSQWHTHSWLPTPATPGSRATTHLRRCFLIFLTSLPPYFFTSRSRHSSLATAFPRAIISPAALGPHLHLPRWRNS